MIYARIETLPSLGFRYITTAETQFFGLNIDLYRTNDLNRFKEWKNNTISEELQTCFLLHDFSGKSSRVITEYWTPHKEFVSECQFIALVSKDRSKFAWLKHPPQWLRNNTGE